MVPLLAVPKETKSAGEKVGQLDSNWVNVMVAKLVWAKGAMKVALKVCRLVQMMELKMAGLLEKQMVS